MWRIKSLTVDKISLLTSAHTPAVPKAGIGFSILKFFRKDEPQKIDKAKLDNILETLDNACGKKKPKPVAKFDEIFEKMSEIAKWKAGTWDSTGDNHRYRIRMPGDFEKDSFKTVKLNKTGKTIQSVMGKLKWEDSMTMQNVMFPKDEWTITEAKDWVSSHKKDWEK